MTTRHNDSARRHPGHLADRPARPQPARPHRHRHHPASPRGWVRSLSNGLVDTTTAHGAVVFGTFALMAEYEAALILSLIHISEPTRPYSISYAVFCLKQK